MSRSIFSLLVVLCLVVSAVAIAQQQITSVAFDEIPEGTELAGGGSPITLQGDTNVVGEISTTTGIRFPDGTLQVTAGGGSAENNGLYSNTIADFSPPNAYTEICIKNGTVESDIHDPGEPTAGGDCEPGDIGWVIERFERNSGAAVPWSTARLECLKDGMRLPEPFEWQVACTDQALAVSDMEDDAEWASNSTMIVRRDNDATSTGVFLIVPVMGHGSCVRASHGSIARSDSVPNSGVLRCAR